MTNPAIFSNDLNLHQSHFGLSPSKHTPKKCAASGPTLAASITKRASKQTYYIVRCLVDRDRMADAYRAYAYFRWVDDRLDQADEDQPVNAQSKRLAFVNRQQALLGRCYHNDRPDDLTREEELLADLVRDDTEINSGLQAYLRHMMAVMAFDARRRGTLISQLELAQYAHHLATAVTEALHYFIGHDFPSPQSEARYLAATGAHITHMVRDTLEDIAAGYFNIPREFLAAHKIDPHDVDSSAYRTWVQNRVKLARHYFQAGKDYLAQVPNLRCRLAGYLYIARFEVVLDTIEREGYRLRPAYPDCKRLRAGMRIGWAALAETLNHCHHEPVSHTLPAR